MKILGIVNLASDYRRMGMKRIVSSTASNSQPGCPFYSVKVREGDGHSLDDESFEHQKWYTR